MVPSAQVTPDGGVVTVQRLSEPPTSNVTPAGRLSATVTASAADGPALVTVIP